MSKITYLDKVALNENPDIPDINKVKADDMNEIKAVVNNNATETSKNTTDIENLQTYSTSEVNTGKVWIDNKPIYRKIITYTYSQGSTTGSVNSELSNLSYINIKAMAHKDSNDSDWEPIPYYGSSSDWCRLFYRSSSNTIQIRSSAISDTFYFYIILEYTKTTD